MKKTALSTRALVMAIPAITLTACAGSHELLDEDLAAARTSIELAEENGAREHAFDALSRARDHLHAAEMALQRGDEEHASRLLTQAELDAELAVAQTNRKKTETALSEINESIEDLRRELHRNSNTEES